MGKSLPTEAIFYLRLFAAENAETAMKNKGGKNGSAIRNSTSRED